MIILNKVHHKIINKIPTYILVINNHHFGKDNHKLKTLKACGINHFRMQYPIKNLYRKCQKKNKKDINRKIS